MSDVESHKKNPSKCFVRRVVPNSQRVKMWQKVMLLLCTKYVVVLTLIKNGSQCLNIFVQLGPGLLFLCQNCFYFIEWYWHKELVLT